MAIRFQFQLSVLLFSLPTSWPAYNAHLLPRLFPWLMPALNAANFTSAYCAVLMIAERLLTTMTTASEAAKPLPAASEAKERKDRSKCGKVNTDNIK